MRINKTVGNLKQVWELLDNASGDLYEAIEQVGNMTNISDEVNEGIEQIDVSYIVNVKNKIEGLINEKGVKFNSSS